MKITVQKLYDALNRYDHLVFEDDTKPFNVNLIGIRGADSTPNVFNDYFNIIWKYNGQWSILTAPITTDPGIFWLKNPLNINGTAILVPGQYRGMWKLGKHKGKYEALVQKGSCTVYRDNDKDSISDVTTIKDTGLFGINFHKAGADSKSVDKWSAGCQVCANESVYRVCMNIFKESAKAWGNSFTYTLIEEKDL